MIRCIERVFQHNDISLGQEVPDAQPTPSRYFCDMPRSVWIIFQRLFFFMSSWFVIIQPTIATHHHSSPARCCSQYYLDEGLALLESFYCASDSSFNLLCCSKTRVCNMVLSSYTFWRITSAWHGVSSIWMITFTLIRSSVFIFSFSVFIAKRTEKKSVNNTTMKKCNG